MRYVFTTDVVQVKRESRKYRFRKGPDDTTLYDEEDLGWFVLLRGSQEALHVGFDEPELKPGDKVMVTLEKI